MGGGLPPMFLAPVRPSGRGFCWCAWRWAGGHCWRRSGGSSPSAGDWSGLSPILGAGGQW